MLKQIDRLMQPNILTARDQIGGGMVVAGAYELGFAPQVDTFGFGARLHPYSPRSCVYAAFGCL
jgi:hypothetical protein